MRSVGDGRFYRLRWPYRWYGRMLWDHEDMIFIKTKNWETIQLVKTIMENNEIYRVVDETDVPG